MNNSKYVYICGVDWQHELGEVPDFTKVYSSVDDLKNQRTCWKQCGIVKIKVELVEWVIEQNLWEHIE